MAANETLSVRKLPFYLFLVLLGFLLFYIFDFVRSNRTHRVPDIPTSAKPIHADTAKKYIENYLTDQSRLAPEYRLTTKNGEILRGFWLSKKTLNSIDSAICSKDKSASVAGYSIYFGKDVDGNKAQVLSLIVRGALPGVKDAGGNSSIVDTGDNYDTIDPCPTQCGEAASALTVMDTTKAN
ncbi:MAG: hypothetical protein QM640_12125 [Niabella sp.]